jgi:hypothetical protein
MILAGLRIRPLDSFSGDLVHPPVPESLVLKPRVLAETLGYWLIP